MFYSYYHNWIIHCLTKLLFSIANSVTKARGSVWKKALKTIIWNNYNPCINFAFLKTVPQMNNISNQ